MEHTPLQFPLSVHIHTHTHLTHPPIHTPRQRPSLFAPLCSVSFEMGWNCSLKSVTSIGEIDPLLLTVYNSPPPHPTLEEKRSTAFHTRRAAKNSNDSRWLLEWESFISSQIRNRPPSCKLTVPAASVSALGTLSSLKSIRAETENTSSASFPGCSTHSINTWISQLNTKWIRRQWVTINAAPR